MANNGSQNVTVRNTKELLPYPAESMLKLKALETVFEREFKAGIITRGMLQAVLDANEGNFDKALDAACFMIEGQSPSYSKIHDAQEILKKLTNPQLTIHRASSSSTDNKQTKFDFDEALIQKLVKEKLEAEEKAEKQKLELKKQLELMGIDEKTFREQQEKKKREEERKASDEKKLLDEKKNFRRTEI